MSLLWYACIFTNTYYFEALHILLEMNWWALSNASLIVRIRSAVHEIFADKAFTATDGLISQSFVVAFVYLAHMRIALICGFPAQLSLWKSAHWLWRYKLNEVCDTIIICNKGTLNIFFNLLEIRICSYIVCWYNDAFVVCTNKISANVGFDAFESLVNIDNIWRWILNKSFTKIATHGNNNLFSR